LYGFVLVAEPGNGLDVLLNRRERQVVVQFVQPLLQPADRALGSRQLLLQATPLPVGETVTLARRRGGRARTRGLGGLRRFDRFRLRDGALPLAQVVAVVALVDLDGPVLDG